MRGRRFTPLALLLAVLLALPAAPPAYSPGGGFAAPPAVGPNLPESLALAASDQGMVELDLVAPSAEALIAISDLVTAAGGEVLVTGDSFAQVRVPPAAAMQLPTLVPGVALGFSDGVSTTRANLSLHSQPLPRTGLSDLATINYGASGIPDFRRQHGSDGTGVLIAVIDSGVDPGHRDLRTTPGGQRKLVDWKDFTVEGLVTTTTPVTWEAAFTAPDGRTFVMPPRPAAVTAARFGYWDESRVTGLINRDLDRNGRPIDRFGVLVVERSGRFDQVYVDTNNDGNFRDEEPLGLFRQTGQVARLGAFRSGEAADKQLAFVVADIDQSGERVSFGFDSLGHGTQVAGIAAAYGLDGLVGAAPGAQLMALKVINSRDEGSWFAIQQAIRYAVDGGARIINVSLGGLRLAAAYDTAAAEWLNTIARQHRVLIIVASGNTGPGISSGATIGSPSEIMSVGAYYSPAMWKRDYGYEVPSEGVWWASGMGPRADGSYLPNLIAPGGAPTTSPRWLHDTGYTISAGTSVATPHVSGAAALLMQAAMRQGLASDGLAVKHSLEFGARRLAGFSAFEQGQGLLTLQSAWSELQQIRGLRPIQARTGEGHGGILSRSVRPGHGELTLQNLAGSLSRMGIVSLESWVRPAFSTMALLPGQSRTLPLQFTPPEQPGIHGAFLRITPRDLYGPSTLVPVTFMTPIPLQNGRTFAATEQLEVARYRRYFVEVPAGAHRLDLQLQMLRPGGQVQGSALVQVFSPESRLVYRSDPLGVNGAGLAASVVIPEPNPGVWEVVVTALPDTTGAFRAAGYQLDLELQPPAREAVRLTVPPGSRTTHQVSLTNPGQGFEGAAEAVGLSTRPITGLWETKEQVGLVDTFTLSSLAARLRIETDIPLPANTDLDLVLFRQDAAQGLVPYWRATTAGSGRERIELTNVPPGQYLVFVFVNGAVPPSLQYQYRRMVVPQQYGLDTTDSVRRWERSQVFSVPITVFAPGSPGRFYGQVALVDGNGQTVAWLPVEVSVGQPQLSVAPMVAQLKQGEPGNVVLELRNESTRALVDGAVTVGGQRYTSRNGRVTVPVTPDRHPLRLMVEANLPAYQFFRREILLPVRPTWGQHPTGIDPQQEPSPWRRKMESMVP